MAIVRSSVGVSCKPLLTMTLIVSLVIPGCATAPDGKTTFTSPEACIAAYTLGGAAAGALIGNMLEKNSHGAKAGAVAGGAIAFAYAWGTCFSKFSSEQSRPEKSYEETAKRTKYLARQGSVVKINDYSINPVMAVPGNTLNFKANYTVMTPTTKDIHVTETRILKFFDESQNKYVEYAAPENTVIAPGTRSANGTISIPKNAQKGEFKLAFQVNAEGKSDMREIPFTVSQGKVALASQ